MLECLLRVSVLCTVSTYTPSRPTTAELDNATVTVEVHCWMNRQHLARWRGLVDTMTQAQEVISGPNTAARAALMSFNLLKPSGNFTYDQV
jgi:hypothetical protein